MTITSTGQAHCDYFGEATTPNNEQYTLDVSIYGNGRQADIQLGLGPRTGLQTIWERNPTPTDPTLPTPITWQELPGALFQPPKDPATVNVFI